MNKPKSTHRSHKTCFFCVNLIVRKLGTLEQLLPEHDPTKDDVVAWARNEAKIKTEKYKKEKETKTVLIPFHADRQLDYGKQTFFRGGYLLANPFIISCK